MAVKISLSTLKKQVENGMKKKQLAEFYGIPEIQVARLLKQAGLKIRKFHTPAFELIDDENIQDNVDELKSAESLENIETVNVQEIFNDIEDNSKEDQAQVIISDPILYNDITKEEDNNENDEEDLILKELLK
jgi:hypothetical protein